MAASNRPRPSLALVAAVAVTAIVLVVGAVLFATTRGSSNGGGGSAPTGAAWATSVSTDLKVEPVAEASSGTLGSSVTTHDVVVGTGAVATAADTVTVQYVGASYTTGKVFDSSWSRGQAAQFSLAQVIPGFAQGIVGMHVGGRRVIFIPSALGYGASGSAPAVSPNEDLTFIVDLVSIP